MIYKLSVLELFSFACFAAAASQYSSEHRPVASTVFCVVAWLFAWGVTRLREWGDA